MQLTKAQTNRRDAKNAEQHSGNRSKIKKKQPQMDTDEHRFYKRKQSKRRTAERQGKSPQRRDERGEEALEESSRALPRCVSLHPSRLCGFRSALNASASIFRLALMFLFSVAAAAPQSNALFP